ncbi:hypothetical protein FKW77_004045 [Venturia effusa]|uniref:Uncharacterized protein n=1 Tax=Venturia effusa TaxID=50376 RepID=A0A517LCA9_9PEZI|nr:hypothetical protein FKW77_004045 [Venturia effusa]
MASTLPTHTAQGAAEMDEISQEGTETNWEAGETLETTQAQPAQKCIKEADHPDISAQAGAEPGPALPKAVIEDESITKGDTALRRKSIAARIESYRISPDLLFSLSKLYLADWQKVFQSLDALHPAILDLRQDVPENYQTQCPGQVGIATERGIMHNWWTLYESFPKPPPQTKESDKLRDYSGFFVGNIERIFDLNSAIVGIEDNAGSQHVGEDEMRLLVPLFPVAPDAKMLKCEFRQIILSEVEAIMEEMVMLLPKVYEITKMLPEQAAYWEEKRLEAEEIRHYGRDCNSRLHPSILAIEYPIPECYRRHFTHTQNAEGVVAHYREIVLDTTQGRNIDSQSMRIWQAYKTQEDKIARWTKELFGYSDMLYNYEDPRYWRYGLASDQGPEPEESKERLIEEDLKSTKDVLRDIVNAFPAFRQAASNQQRRVQVMCNRPSSWTTSPSTYRTPMQIEADARRAYGARLRRRARSAERREAGEEADEGYYMAAQRLLMAD